MARDSMVCLIGLLRMKVNDSDFSIWSDDELQNYLDMHRIYLFREPLIYDPGLRIYQSRYGMLEADVTIWDSELLGAMEIVNSNYASNLLDGTFIFANAQYGTYYLEAKSYNIHNAIAECLEQLAMDQNRAKTWNRGSVTFNHYDLMAMAQYHRNLSGSRSTSLLRVYDRK